MKADATILKRMAHMRFARAKRWIADEERFNAWVALCEAMYWRHRAERFASNERVVAARERSARIRSAMKGSGC